MENNQNRKQQNNGEIEIDLIQLFHELKKRWYVLLIAALAGGILFGAYTKFLITPQYESTSVMYILTKETTLTSLADLQIGTQLTNDYQVIVTTRSVLENTLDELGLSDAMNYRQLKSKITISNPTSTRILNITVKDPDPELARDMANAVASNASEFIADTMEITPPKIIEQGQIPTAPSSPNMKKNALIGVLVGLIIAGGIIVIRMLLNDAVTTEEDVEKYLGLSVLGSLPDRSATKKKRTVKRKVDKK